MTLQTQIRDIQESLDLLYRHIDGELNKDMCYMILKKVNRVNDCLITLKINPNTDRVK